MQRPLFSKEINQKNVCCFLLQLKRCLGDLFGDRNLEKHPYYSPPCAFETTAHSELPDALIWSPTGTFYLKANQLIFFQQR